jgi:replicative superfamily II helicase
MYDYICIHIYICIYVGELAMLRLLRTRPGAKIVYVAPLKALARER